jgi:hypothetical protein
VTNLKRLTELGKRSGYLRAGRRVQPKLPDTFGGRLATWLRHTRVEHSISWRAISQAGGPTESALRMLELRGSDPGVTTYLKLCRALGENPAELLLALESKSRAGGTD